jgi:hypothetical protein
MIEDREEPTITKADEAGENVAIIWNEDVLFSGAPGQRRFFDASNKRC